MSSQDAYFSQSRLLWKPAQPGVTPVEVFRRMINRKHGLNLANYHDLHKYSVEDYTFWLDLWEALNIVSSIPPNPKQIIAPGRYAEIPDWFPGSRLNYAENLLWRNNDSIACTASGESGVVTNYTFRELRQLVTELAAALRVGGLQVGDRVAAIVTNSVTAVALALATASIGGIFSSTATDMGTEGILDRYRQINPKFVFAETEVMYAGKAVNLVPKITDVINDLADKGLQKAILLPSARTGKELLHDINKAINLSAFLATGDGRELTFEQLPFGQPLFILYSSGTSGKPKCIVHSAGGVLMQTQKDQRTHMGLSAHDTYFQYTTTGWMMWTFMLSGLASGARIILYDGSPFYPDLKTYLKFIDEQGVSVLGTSPRLLAEIAGRGLKPRKSFYSLSVKLIVVLTTIVNQVEIGSFEALRVLGVTVAVLTPPMFEWAQDAFGGDRIHLISTSGGTDICSSFVTGASSLPVYSGEMSCKTLGMKVEVFDPSGNNIEHTGSPGELVCTRPHPSMPLYFWGDPSGEKLRDAYFNMYPGIWRQGDFMIVNPVTKGIMILGRSDGVLNPSGVRFGSGEIYSVLEKFTDSLDDSLCVGQRRPQDLDERVLLFLKMRPGRKLTSDLETQIKTEIRKALSARHVPSYIFEIEDIPYTVNGKKIEIAVKQIVSGSDLQPSGTVANPESLELYYKYRDLNQTKAKL
ncbi:acetoacetyl-CoA synthetase [Lyophyllum atratum]|nr:acetoacetyl-CoA synthetase [Lyophyllum atratum]